MSSRLKPWLSGSLKENVVGFVAASAVNHAGRSSGLTAPNGPAQTALIRTALADGHVQPENIAFVSLHGTGTPLGDPIEVSALGQGLANKQGPPSRVMLGTSPFSCLDSLLA
jgi:acyl transferase domain-containing protein